MASGFFALLDDIAVIMDDVAVTTKVATQKASGLLSDDLAVTAEKASGFRSSRELPILWSICKGSFLNKLIVLPIAFILSAFLPSAIVPILIFGGIFLSWEGAEKVFHYISHRGSKKEANIEREKSEQELLVEEKKKIKSAIIVDFILSIEIVIVSLSTVMEQEILIQVLSVSLAAILATIGVYGLVALIVRMDDFGIKLISMTNGKENLIFHFGWFLIKALPWIIKSLSIIGTIAMFLVAGGIFVHNIHQFHDLLHHFPLLLGELLIGFVIGTLAYMITTSIQRITGR